MRYNSLLFLIFLGGALLLTACSPKTTAATNGEIDWTARARAYQKNPAALQALVEECEAKEDELLTLRRDMNRNQSAQNSANANYQSAQAEIQQLRQQLATSEEQLGVARNALANRDELITDQQMVRGIVFRVQLGAFAQSNNKVNQDLATGDALTLQDQNGMQKVVVSQFRTYSNAKALRDQLRRMGVSGAFIVAYQDGQRIETSEALRLSGQQ